MTDSMSSTQAELQTDYEFANELEGGRGLLNNFSIELLPEHAAGFTPSHAAFPPGSLVFLTHIPGKPLEAQRSAARVLKSLGYEPVPHLAARNFRSTDEYALHLADLAKLGVTTALMIGGNPSSERTEMASAIELLRHPVVQDVGLKRIFFGGHPEGHPVIPSNALRTALIEKVSLARVLGIDASIVTQFGFDGSAMTAWAEELRRDGIDVPIRFGVAGVTSLPKLIKFALMCGVGASISALTRQGGALFKVMRDLDPSEVIAGLGTGIQVQRLHGVGLHFFPFGGWERTIAWVENERKGRC